MVQLRTGMVCSCAPIFMFFYGPPGFFLRGKLKNYHFWHFWNVSPHFKSHNGEIWHKGADLGLPPHAKFCIKKLLKGI